MEISDSLDGNVEEVVVVAVVVDGDEEAFTLSEKFIKIYSLK